MKWERRKKTPSKRPDFKTAELPYDYLRLVEQTVTQALLKGLTEIKKTHPISEFYADGVLFGDEVMLTLTLSHGEKNLAATTVYASADYILPPAQVITQLKQGEESEETESILGQGLEKTLAACVDAASSIFDFYLDPADPEKIAQIANHSLGALEEAPFDWTLFNQTKPPVWVKMDKSNPKLENLTEKFLKENDPNYDKNVEMEETSLNVEAEEFLEQRLEAIKKARNDSSGSNSGGPIRH